MKNLIIIIGIILISAIPATASMTKIYIGDENGQSIYGLETVAANNDGAIGAEFRTYMNKKGIVVNGVEYGSLPGRNMYSFNVAGKSTNAMVKYEHKTYINNFAKRHERVKYEENSITLRGGNSDYLFYE